ncbi:hypothetical protein CLOM_g12776 [Closterium sp. NIES-68]|nr:hypothetical protein CLOM_g12776 [Closterium sp. NIES-68]
MDLGLVRDGEAVEYRDMRERRALKRGRLSRQGVTCDCCGRMFNLSGFEAHTGVTYRRPAANMFLEDGRTLAACKLEAEKSFHYRSQGFGDDTVIFCDQCEREYHVSCLRDRGWADLKELPTGRFFCRPQCRTVFFGLQRLIGKPIALPGGFSWTLLHAEGPRSEAGGVTKEARRHDSLLRERTGEVERKLRCSMEVMRECFHPIKDAFTNEDLVPIIVHSKRVYGAELAEMPLIGTRFRYRRQGISSHRWVCADSCCQLSPRPTPRGAGALGLRTCQRRGGGSCCSWTCSSSPALPSSKSPSHPRHPLPPLRLGSGRRTGEGLVLEHMWASKGVNGHRRVKKLKVKLKLQAHSHPSQPLSIHPSSLSPNCRQALFSLSAAPPSLHSTPLALPPPGVSPGKSPGRAWGGEEGEGEQEDTAHAAAAGTGGHSAGAGASAADSAAAAGGDALVWGTERAQARSSQARTSQARTLPVSNLYKQFASATSPDAKSWALVPLAAEPPSPSCLFPPPLQYSLLGCVVRPQRLCLWEEAGALEEAEAKDEAADRAEGEVKAEQTAEGEAEGIAEREAEGSAEREAEGKVEGKAEKRASDGGAKERTASGTGESALVAVRGGRKRWSEQQGQRKAARQSPRLAGLEAEKQQRASRVHSGSNANKAISASNAMSASQANQDFEAVVVNRVVSHEWSRGGGERPCW